MIASLLLLGSAAHAQDLDPTLLTQIWVTAFDQDVSEQADPAGYGDPEDDQGFKLRRARAGFTGSDGNFFYGLVFGMSSGADGLANSEGTVGIVDAYGGWNVHRHFALTAGVQKVPFGREQLLSSGELVFQERAITSNHIAPGRATRATDPFVVAEADAGVVFQDLLAMLARTPFAQRPP